MYSALSFTDTGRESARPSAHRLPYLTEKSQGGAETSVWQCWRQTLLSQAVQPLRDALSHWSGELTNQQPARLAENTASDTCRMYTGKRDGTKVPCKLHAVRWHVEQCSFTSRMIWPVKALKRYYVSTSPENLNMSRCRVLWRSGRIRNCFCQTSGEVHTCSCTEPRHTFLQPPSAHCSRKCSVLSSRSFQVIIYFFFTSGVFSCVSLHYCVGIACSMKQLLLLLIFNVRVAHCPL